MNIDRKKANHLQLGKFAEAYSKFVFQANGFVTYTSDVDDRGIDFLAESSDKRFYKVQVKSVKKSEYVFMRKTDFRMNENMLLCLLRFKEGSEPDIYIIPAEEWNVPNELLVSRDFGNGMKSKPEWGVNISKKNMPLLEKYGYKVFFDAANKEPEKLMV